MCFQHSNKQFYVFCEEDKFFRTFIILVMAGLVADYSSEGESEESDSSQSSCKVSNEIPLPKPSFIMRSDECTEGSVFTNPFVEADNAKTAILEKHVKMISTDVKMVNGKKICWNYRKNKCRFGHNCKYAHDSDLQIDKSTIIPSETKAKQINVKKMADPKAVKEFPKKKKKRAGLPQDIVPSKKVLKAYHEQKRS